MVRLMSNSRLCCNRPDLETVSPIVVVPVPADRIEVEAVTVVVAVGRSGPVVTVGPDIVERSIIDATKAGYGEKDAVVVWSCHFHTFNSILFCELQ